MREIILPDDVKPALEWVNGRVLQKVTPKRKHALAQGTFVSALLLWCRERGNGMAGPEWHFQVQPPEEVSRTLVPDVAFVSYERLPMEQMEATDIPRVAPDVVVEVRSPGDRQKDIDEKVRVYLAAGTLVIFLVDPQTKTVSIRDPQGARTVGRDGLIEHSALPGFALEARTLFELPRPKQAN